MAIIVMTKGAAPTITSFSAPLPRTPCTMNRLTPTGGVIIAASTRMMIMIPNHTGSYPSLKMTGAMIGMVVIIMAMVSMKQPRIKIGRASCRERVEMTVGGGAFKRKKNQRVGGGMLSRAP